MHLFTFSKKALKTFEASLLHFKVINDNPIKKGFAEALKILFVERSEQEVFSKGSTRS